MPKNYKHESPAFIVHSGRGRWMAYEEDGTSIAWTSSERFLRDLLRQKGYVVVRTEKNYDSVNRY